MSNVEYIVFLCLLIFLVIVITIELILRKKKNQSWWKGFYTGKSMFDDRNKTFLMLEVLLLIGFVFGMIVFTTLSMTIPYYVHMVVFFLLLYGFRGLEQWMFKREEKEYQHYWLGTSYFVVALFIFYIAYVVIPS